MQEAALGPMRDIQNIQSISAHDVRPITSADFADAFSHVRASVADSEIAAYLEWDRKFGVGGHSQLKQHQHQVQVQGQGQDKQP